MFKNVLFHVYVAMQGKMDIFGTH